MRKLPWPKCPICEHELTPERAQRLHSAVSGYRPGLCEGCGQFIEFDVHTGLRNADRLGRVGMLSTFLSGYFVYSLPEVDFRLWGVLATSMLVWLFGALKIMFAGIPSVRVAKKIY
jgi:hypothetical protein